MLLSELKICLPIMATEVLLLLGTTERTGTVLKTTGNQIGEL
jgi:hypothetical protein